MDKNENQIEVDDDYRVQGRFSDDGTLEAYFFTAPAEPDQDYAEGVVQKRVKSKKITPSDLTLS